DHLRRDRQRLPRADVPRRRPWPRHRHVRRCGGTDAAPARGADLPVPRRLRGCGPARLRAHRHALVGDPRGHRAGGRPPAARAGRDAAGPGPGGDAGPVVGRRRLGAGPGRRAVPDDALARSPGGRRGERRDRHPDAGAGLLDAAVPRDLPGPGVPRRRPGTGHRARQPLHRTARQPARPGRLDRRRAGAPRHHHPGHPRPRGRTLRALRLHRAADAQPAPLPPAAGPGLGRGAAGRRGRPDDRTAHPGPDPAGAAPDRPRPRPHRTRHRAHHLRLGGGAPQPLRRAAVDGRGGRRRHPARADGGLGARGGSRALPAGRGAARPPGRPGRRAVGRPRRPGHHVDRGVVDTFL
ncbi:MAG: oxidoreductase domain protein, partial [uncultured Friedmanniella sp.]